MSASQPDIVSCPDSSFSETASRLLGEQAKRALLQRSDSGRDLTHMLGEVDCVFSDLDGTLTGEGLRTLPPQAATYLAKLRQAGITIMLVSGKPYEEIAPLMQALPQDLRVSAIYEKGAYKLVANTEGTFSKTYLLSSPKLEQEVAALRRLVAQHWQTMETMHVGEYIRFGWAGSGKHQSVISIDMFAGEAPKQYERLVGTERDQLKLKDPALLTAIEAELRAFVDANRPGWSVVHLGNANFEIAPPNIEKDTAIKQTPEFRRARGVLVLGDSGNDRKMFALRQDARTAAGLVLHNPAAVALTAEVDYVTFGMANLYPLLDCLLAAKAHVG